MTAAMEFEATIRRVKCLSPRAWSARNQRSDMRPFILGQITRIVVVPAAFRRSDTALSERIARWTVGRPDMALFIFTRAILANEPIQIFTRGRMARDFHVHRRYRRNSCVSLTVCRSRTRIALRRSRPDT